MAIAADGHEERRSDNGRGKAMVGRKDSHRPTGKKEDPIIHHPGKRGTPGWQFAVERVTTRLGLRRERNWSG